MLDLLKVYLGLTDDSQDSLLNLLISMAQDAVKSYCLIDTVPTPDLDNAVIKLTAVYYQKRGSDAASYQMQGARAQNIINDIPGDIKAMLASFRQVRSI
ncbi:MAG: head-tail connector protein [Sporolactobacillus sp.]